MKLVPSKPWVSKHFQDNWWGFGNTKTSQGISPTENTWVAFCEHQFRITVLKTNRYLQSHAQQDLQSWINAWASIMPDFLKKRFCDNVENDNVKNVFQFNLLELSWKLGGGGYRLQTLQNLRICKHIHLTEKVNVAKFWWLHQNVLFCNIYTLYQWQKCTVAFQCSLTSLYMPQDT